MDIQINRIAGDRPIPDAVRKAAEAHARRYEHGPESHNYEACALCGGLKHHYSGPAVEESMFLWWGGPCEACADMARRFPDIYGWVCKVLAFQRGES